MSRGSNPTNRLLGRWLNRRKPSWPITPASPGVVGSGSGTPHYCPDVSHVMLKSGLSGSGQWTHLRVPFFLLSKKYIFIFSLSSFSCSWTETPVTSYLVLTIYENFHLNRCLHVSLDFVLLKKFKAKQVII